VGDLVAVTIAGVKSCECPGCCAAKEGELAEADGMAAAERMNLREDK
jgi:hypothetical protein